MEYRYLAFNGRRICSVKLRRVQSTEITKQRKKKYQDINTLEITVRYKFCTNHQEYLERERNPLGN